MFTYNTTTGDVRSGHVITLAAYDPSKGFGFLNSGADKPYVKPNEIDHELTWKTEIEIEDYTQDPIGLSEDNFVVISSTP